MRSSRRWAATVAATVAVVGTLGWVGEGPAGADGRAGSPRVVAAEMTPTDGGMWVFTADGTVFTSGDATHHGELDLRLDAVIVDGEPTPDGGGYWLFAADGGVFAFGNATFRGSAGGLPLVSPIVSGTATADGGGYWLFAADGGVFAYGNAPFHGSAGGLPLDAPIVSGEPTATGRGYTLTAADGGVFNYGDSVFHGSAGGLDLAAPIIDIAVLDGGYYLIGADGGVFAYGDVPFLGSAAATGLRYSSFAATSDLGGYRVIARDGASASFGTVPPFPAIAAPGLAPDPVPTRAQLVTVDLRLTPVVTLDQPLGMAWRHRDPGIYVATKGGVVHRLVDGVVAADPVIDLSGRVSDGSERGLLGIAFDPRNGRLFLNWTDGAGDTQVASWWVGDDGVADPGSERHLLSVAQPGPGHNGGSLAFDDDGHLFVAVGDGGGSRGRDAQDLTNLLGAVSRIRPHLNRPGYEVPHDNPFVGQPNIRPEIWAYGFRNPWRLSIDHATGDVWLGDVGDNDVEEIDRIPAASPGGNYGWFHWEGSQRRIGGGPSVVVFPEHEYPHTVGVSVTGGYVYRGTAVDGLGGAYVFGDLTGAIWALGADGVVDTGLRQRLLASFGEGPDGELWVVSVGGTVARIEAW